jgi:hypothetical protein|tara:strand:+ start:557 stop:1174 length:618 start_codon:yes stop_codon:yes gene_type:complete
MANRNTQGFGLKAAMRVGNTPSIQGQSKYEIDAGESNAIFNGEPVKVDISASTGGYIVTAAAGTAAVGVLNGVVYTDATTLKPTFSNFYPAATTPANSEDVTAFVNDDPFQEFIIATDATLGGTLALRKSKIGLTYATTAAAGSTTTGKSSVQLGISTAATTAKQLRMVRVAEDPENQEQTSANCSVVVKINLHQYTVGSLATGI